MAVKRAKRPTIKNINSIVPGHVSSQFKRFKSFIKGKLYTATFGRLLSRIGRTKRNNVKKDGPRMLKKQQYKSFRLHKKIRPYQRPLPSVRTIFRQTRRVIRQNWRLFTVFTIIYLVLTLVLVKGLQQSLDIPGIKDSLSEVQTGTTGKAITTASLLGLVATSTGVSGQPNSGVYQTIIALVIILAVIWASRQILSGQKIKARDAFYRGMYPLVPFVLVVTVVSLQLIPLGIAGWLYQVIIAGGIAVQAIEKAIWISFIVLLVLLSLYMVVSSSFALVIVTLPEMTPMRALRSARHLVLHRRGQILRRLAWFATVLILWVAILMIPIIIWLSVIAEWVFFVLSGFLVIVPVVFHYLLYMELLNEKVE